MIATVATAAGDDSAGREWDQVDFNRSETPTDVRLSLEGHADDLASPTTNATSRRAPPRSNARFSQCAGCGALKQD